MSTEETNDPCLLYLITPPAIDVDVFAVELRSALDSGPVGALQLRLKDCDDDLIRRAAEQLLPICHEFGVPLIMNDRPDLAAETDCDGVHVGQTDASYTEARRIIGGGDGDANPSAIVGVTCHASRHLAMEAAENGADYVAFGAFFPSDTKEVTHHADVELARWWSEMMVVPSVAIGGITIENCRPLVAAGVDFLAVVGGVWAHTGGPAEAIKGFNQVIAETPRQ